MKTEQQKIEKQRRKLWIKAWCATVNAVNCYHTHTATKYADACLKDYDERLKNKTI